ncbi:hypothetical protein E2C01_065549 [Portunus trituberculatus]|uniref:Uncharacterized protein n=1 Tax=Portunus trituberculatus TaxID=210409 RepID=A0A5B7HPW8_PORTR|nr:hypothetical protein [Portunus trituberculatus]
MTSLHMFSLPFPVIPASGAGYTCPVGKQSAAAYAVTAPADLAVLTMSYSDDHRHSGVNEGRKCHAFRSSDVPRRSSGHGRTLSRSRSPSVRRERSEQGDKAGHFNKREGGRNQSTSASTPTHH